MGFRGFARVRANPFWNFGTFSEPVLGISARLAKPVLTLRNLCISIPLQWWYWVRRMRQSPQAPLFWGAPLENGIYSFGFAQWTIWSEDLFFFFGEHLFWEKNREIRGEIEVKTYCFFTP